MMGLRSLLLLPVLAIGCSPDVETLSIVTIEGVYNDGPLLCHAP